MGNILRATFFAAVLSPFTAWVCLEATKHRNASGPYMSWPTRWYILLAIGTVILQISLIERLRYHLRARAKGCLSAPCYPHKDPFLGLDLLIPVIRAFKENTVIYNFQRRFEKYGHTHWSIAFTDWTINTEDPENIKAILTNIDDFPIAGPRLHTVLPLLGSESIFASNGQAWHNARSMLRPTFVRDQIADLECFDRHISNLLRAIPRDGSTFDMQKLLLDMTMDSSTDFMLGYSTNLLIKPLPEARTFIQAFEYVSATMGRRGSTGTAFLPSRELDDQIKIIQSFVESYMEKALADGRKHARERKYVFLDAMADSGASMEYIRDQVLSIIIAGRDTTAGAISSTIYFLARHPEVVAKVRKEVLELNEKNPSWEQLKNMSYLSNTIKEALRLFPPIAVNSRTSSREVTLPRGGGPDGRSPILVPKGTPARWSAFCMQRRQDLYGPDAEEFRPERWEKLRPGWEYLPFSGGPRICVGQQFATTQVIFTIYRLLQNFKSIQARESGMMLVKTTTTSILANGCQISMDPA